MKCSQCKVEGHKINNKKFHPDISNKKSKQPKKYSGNSFKSGNEYERKIHKILSHIKINNTALELTPIAGSKQGSDIIMKGNQGPIGFEVKNKGAFEGGSKKLTYCEDRLGIQSPCIQKYIIADRKLYNGLNLPCYEGKKTLEDWKAVEQIFKPDIYIDAPADAIASYYKKCGTYYIQIEGYGLYHTEQDILNLGVPFFSCKSILRIRSSKHMKKGVATDITAALQFDKRNLEKSPFSLDGKLPPVMLLEQAE